MGFVCFHILVKNSLSSTETALWKSPYMHFGDIYKKKKSVLRLKSVNVMGWREGGRMGNDC